MLVHKQTHDTNTREIESILVQIRDTHAELLMRVSAAEGWMTLMSMPIRVPLPTPEGPHTTRSLPPPSLPSRPKRLPPLPTRVASPCRSSRARAAGAHALAIDTYLPSARPHPRSSTVALCTPRACASQQSALSGTSFGPLCVLEGPHTLGTKSACV
jgi:hypothetical protein